MKAINHAQRYLRRALAVTLAMFLGNGSLSVAASYTWISTSGGNWDDTTATGWNTGGSDYPKTAGDSATFQQGFADGTIFDINVADAVVGALALNPSSQNNRLNIVRTASNVLTFDATGVGTCTLS